MVMEGSASKGTYEQAKRFVERKSQGGQSRLEH